MSTNAKARRLPSSCVNCRRRKIRASRHPQRPSQPPSSRSVSAPSNPSLTLLTAVWTYQCDKSSSRDCRRCERLGLDCAVTDEVVVRPFYHTSKERFELMAAVVRHFSPNTPLTVENLRDYVSTLSKATSNSSSCRSPGQEASPPPSISQPGTISKTPASHSQSYEHSYTQTQEYDDGADDGTSPGLSESSLDGEFIPDATCQRRFDNASSCAVLNSRISSCIPDNFPRLSMLQRETTIDLSDGQPLWAIPAIALPPRKLSEQCGVTFFTQINSVLYILSPEKFFNSVEAAYSGRDTPTSTQAIIHLVVALANRSPENFETARMQMESVLEEGSLESVQAMMLMSLYRQNQNQRHTAWVALGSATRIAQSLGMHIRTEDESRMVAEQKTRLWWSLYELDQWSSSNLGRSPDTSVNIDTVPSPCESLTASATTPPMYAAASARLAQFLSRATSCIFLRKTCRGRDIDDLLHGLNAWWASLPGHLTQAILSESFARATLYLRLRYHYILVLITRTFLFNPTWESSTMNRYVEICNDNNDKSIEIILDMQARNILTDSFWFDSYYILSTSLILLLRILKNPSCTDLHSKAEIMRNILQEYPGKIQAYATECFKQVLEDINNPQDKTIGPTFDTVMTTLDLWDESELVF
ncbi:hypothetical protein N8I77_008602 [Diaporthe amygdali]|uniref:Xylanolytic transcriptional activator regulatory domain-containing protein n=1 Tax=Phomopsis amygdali TaxID=1214568 RepID=A0AAD9SFR8_PHOAM|nr:hypothetical protein N8I77_008602 [Diaporthe amygdali]